MKIFVFRCPPHPPLQNFFDCSITDTQYVSRLSLLSLERERETSIELCEKGNRITLRRGNSLVSVPPPVRCYKDYQDSTVNKPLQARRRLRSLFLFPNPFNLGTLPHHVSLFLSLSLSLSSLTLSLPQPR